jgi:hypothetical protein
MMVLYVVDVHMSSSRTIHQVQPIHNNPLDLPPKLALHKMDPLGLISSAIELARTVADTVATVKQNQVECKELCGRVNRLQPMIVAFRNNTVGSANLESASLIAERLVELLETINEFILQFCGKNPPTGLASKLYKLAGKACNASNHAETFDILNNKLDSVLIELNFIETNTIAAFLSKTQLTEGARIEDSFMEDPPMESFHDKRSILGRGVFATTHRMLNTMDARKYAVKRVDLADAEKNGVTRWMLRNECAILEKLTHVHIARYFMNFYSHKNQYFNIVMELIQGGTLAEKVACNPPPTDVEIVEWARQMASALSYMHGEGVQHRDLKPDNVMLTSNSKIKVIDLGLASAVTSAAYMHTKVGTTTYSSYEKLLGLGYDGRDDVWAVGCILLELVIRAR